MQKLLLAAAAIGLTVNLLSGFSVVLQGRESDASIEEVRHSYEVIQRIDALKLLLLESERDRKSPARLKEYFEKLHALVEDMPAQADLAKELTTLSNERILQTTGGDSAMQILMRMATAESALLSSRLKTHLREAETSSLQTLLASALDVCLILLFVGLFFHERRRSLRLQAAISDALTQVKKTNQQMRLTMEATQARFKTVVHDLKNPLGSIRGFAELIHEESADRKSVLDMAGVIQKVSNSTLSLVNTILQEAKAADEPKELVSVPQCLQEVRLYLQPAATAKEQTIQLEGRPPAFSLFGSHQQIVDIFFNIIGNALKFSPPGSVVRISCHEGRDFFEVTVKDEGPGFMPEDFKNLFVAEARLSARPTGDESSSGIGLYSVRRSMSLLAGQIEVSNNPDRGARVTLRFPRSARLETLSPAPKEPPESPASF